MRAIDDRGPPPGIPPKYNLAADVLSAAARTPDKTALVIAGATHTDTFTYAQLAEDTARLAGSIAARGLPSGSRVALRLGNTVDLPLAFLAAVSVDCVPTVLSAALTAPEVARALEHTAPALLVADTALPLPASGVPTVSVEDLRRSGAPPASPVQGNPDRPCYIVFTSGTTATPRAVLHAHRALRARRMMWEGWYGLTSEDRLLHPGALNWTYTLGTGLLDPWASGATAIIPESGTDHTLLPDLIRRHKASIFAATPAHYRRLLAGGGTFSFPHLRHGLSAGEKLSDNLRDRWSHATGTQIHEAFGMSECSTFLSGAPGRPAPPGTLGHAQPGRRIAILGDDGQPASRGEDGLIAIDTRDPGLMLGYLRPDGGLDAPSGEWFETSDRAVMEPAGAIRHLGRNDDVMNAGGVRVSPLEVEEALAAHPSVRECAVTEVSLKADTTVIAAFVLCAGALDEPSLREHMSERLASHKVPRLYVRVDALPRNPNGKLMRRALRDGWKAP